MKVGTIWKTRVFGMRYGGRLSRTRDPRERTLPDGSQSCGSARDAGATREYQRDSSSKRPAFSVASSPSLNIGHKACGHPKGWPQETTSALT